MEKIAKIILEKMMMKIILREEKMMILQIVLDYSLQSSDD